MDTSAASRGYYHSLTIFEYSICTYKYCNIPPRTVAARVYSITTTHTHCCKSVTSVSAHILLPFKRRLQSERFVEACRGNVVRVRVRTQRCCSGAEADHHEVVTSLSAVMYRRQSLKNQCSLHDHITPPTTAAAQPLAAPVVRPPPRGR